MIHGSDASIVDTMPAGIAQFICHERYDLHSAHDDSCVSRTFNLTTLPPELVASILDETLPPEVTLFELAAGAPV